MHSQSHGGGRDEESRREPEQEPGQQNEGLSPKIVLPILLLGSVGILLLPEIDPGNTLPGILALLLAWNAAIAPLMTKLRSQSIKVLLLYAGTVFVAGFVVFLATRAPAEKVSANAIHIEGADKLSPASPATIVFPQETPDRENLGLRLHLDDYIGSGDCVNSPTLTLIPSFGGVQRPPVEVLKPGTSNQEAGEVEIPLGGPVQDLRITVKYDAPEGCTVRLQVQEAEFYG